MLTTQGGIHHTAKGDAVARLRRKTRNRASADHDSVELDGADHAWWAQGKVNHVPGTPTEDPADAPAPEPTFFDEWSTDSLYVNAGTNPPPADEDVDVPSVPLFAVDEAYVILGLGQDASWDEVVSAHRKLAKRYHPDRLVGASPEAQKRGEERMRELNVAYETLRRLDQPKTRTLFTGA